MTKVQLMKWKDAIHETKQSDQYHNEMILKHEENDDQDSNAAWGSNDYDKDATWEKNADTTNRTSVIDYGMKMML
jgi:3-keto-L-gulonate-6-phosphate decarboxylase